MWRKVLGKNKFVRFIRLTLIILIAKNLIGYFFFSQLLSFWSYLFNSFILLIAVGYTIIPMYLFLDYFMKDLVLDKYRRIVNIDEDYVKEFPKFALYDKKRKSYTKLISVLHELDDYESIIALIDKIAVTLKRIRKDSEYEKYSHSKNALREGELIKLKRRLRFYLCDCQTKGRNEERLEEAIKSSRDRLIINLFFILLIGLNVSEEGRQLSFFSIEIISDYY